LGCNVHGIMGEFFEDLLVSVAGKVDWRRVLSKQKYGLVELREKRLSEKRDIPESIGKFTNNNRA
jgi:hypothetical protein